ncbi:MAG: hypothetical protein IPL53_01860 [Ignavibacteria bacterium]|nr:hypothetical protein [Ignavibacteria bacterium]
MDDDIKVSSISLIDDLFELKKKYELVGSHITGMNDDSILGHIATDLNLSNEKMLSGGFVVLSPKTVSNYFLNIYNEDWIWFYFQLKSKRYFQTGNVFHSITNPFYKFKSKIIFKNSGRLQLKVF